MDLAYDLIVLGAGPGGYVAAVKAAKLGKKVAVAENREAGGTCLNRGCIPTKALIHAADLLRELACCDQLGIHAERVGYDFAALHARREQVVTRLRAGVEGLLRTNKVEVLRGTARIEGPGLVTVDGKPYAAGHILIATGSRPARPPIPGLDLPGVVTSDDLLTGEGRAFKRLVIIGGGVIGVELAGVYQALGCEVTIVEALERLLPGMDREISQNLTMVLKKRGVAAFTGARVMSVAQKDGGLVCNFEAKGEVLSVEADGVLVSIGRRANTEGLCAEGVDLGLERGQIPVDGRFETRVPGIHAVGDVVLGGVQLAHAASAQGVNAVCAMFGEEPPYDLAVAPSCVYTSPEIASVGITADQAKERGIPAVAGKALMSANGKSMIEGAERGFIKLVFHAETEALLGAQLMCSRATDLIGGLTDAVVSGLTMRQLEAAIRPHPTFCEAVGEAVENAREKRKGTQEAGK